MSDGAWFPLATSHTRARAHARTHARARTRTHAHTHTHTHTHPIKVFERIGPNLRPPWGGVIAPRQSRHCLLHGVRILTWLSVCPHADTQVVVWRELVTAQHLRPRIAVL